jgi:hypothetical protein
MAAGVIMLSVQQVNVLVEEGVHGSGKMVGKLVEKSVPRVRIEMQLSVGML